MDMLLSSLRSALRKVTGRRCARRVRRSSRPLIATLALSVTLLSGCATEPKEAPPWNFPQLPPPHVTPLPLTVGVHYPEAFLRGKYEEKSMENGWTIWYMHGPGPAGAALFDSVLRATFAKVVDVREWPPAEDAAPDVALVLVPRLVELSTVHGSVTYEIGFYAPEGSRIGAWTVHATAEVTFFTGHETFTASVLRDAAARLLIGLRDRGEITAHLPPRSPGPDTQQSMNRKPKADAIAVLPKTPGDEEWLDCVQNGMRDGTPMLKFVEFEPFRDALFPWFEPSGDEPATAEAWAKRLSDPMLAEGAEKLGVRYVVLVGGKTINGTLTGSFQCTVSGSAGGCFGMSTGTRQTGMKVTLADLARRELVGAEELTENGEYTWIGLIVPIGFASTTETDACRKASEKVLLWLEGR